MGSRRVDDRRSLLSLDGPRSVIRPAPVVRVSLHDDAETCWIRTRSTSKCTSPTSASRPDQYVRRKDMGRGKGRRASGGKGRRTKSDGEEQAEGKRRRRKLRSDTQRAEVFHYPNSDGGFRKQLAGIGMRVVRIEADGNCFFRAVADQLAGDEGDHNRIREQVVEYMQDNQEAFEPFVEDDQVFEIYCEQMKEDGTWAGNMELQAASLVLQVNIYIHQAGRPAWRIQNFTDREARTIHLSYHDGDHYNSLRMSNDFGPGPALPFCFVDAQSVVVPVDSLPESAAGHAEESSSPWSEERTMADNEMTDVEEELRHEAREGHMDSAKAPTVDDARNDMLGNGPSEQEKMESSTAQKQKPPPRNKRCPCGSGLKYGKCCRSRHNLEQVSMQELSTRNDTVKVVCI